MTLYIFRNGQQGGPYSADQVRAWLSSGQIQPTDLACYAGGTAWLPLHTVLEMGNRPSGSGGPSVQYVGVGERGEGWALIIIGAVLSGLGLMLSVTLIGAIVGIPFLFVGLPMLIYGRVKYNRSMMEKLKASVRDGVMQGMHVQQLSTSPHSWQQPYPSAQPSGPLPATSLFVCSACGEPLQPGMAACRKCAAALG